MDRKDVKDLRTDYTKNTLVEDAAGHDPFELFGRWFDDAVANENEANAVTLATGGSQPSARTVLLKEVRNEEFVFYTNYSSAKGKAIAANPNVCLLFFWQNEQRQVRIEGRAEKVSAGESEAYFKSRPLQSQIGALASNQSAVLKNRDELDKRYEELMQKYSDGQVPCPDNWGGYAVKPVKFEFWQGRASRLHDRLEYQLINGVWVRRRLSP